MSKLQVGYAEVNINPKLGIGIHGYYVPRYAKNFLDELLTSAMVVQMGEKTVVLIATDNCLILNPLVRQLLEAIEAGTGIPKENVYITASHTHTGPYLKADDFFDADAKVIDEYFEFFKARMVDAVKLAMQDVKPAKMGFCTGLAPERVAYIRRYKMKDGSTMTCPPIGDENIDHPIGELDQRVHVLRIDREGGHSIVLMNYGIHADTIGGELVSADFPHWLRKTVEATLDGTKCMFFPGAQGDVGSTRVFPQPGDMNDTEISFDNEMKSPGMARFVGRALAGTILQVFDKVAYFDVDDIAVVHKTVRLAANVPDKKDLPLAHKYKELHEAGRDCDIPYEAMELTTVVAEAMRMCRLENGPEYFDMPLIGIRFGKVAFVGIPGEPFTDIGVAVKDTEGFDMIMPCALTNGSMGYLPMQSAFDEGGYEARSSSYKAGVAEGVIAGCKALLEELK